MVKNLTCLRQWKKLVNYALYHNSLDFVGNKAKGRVWKRVFKENKARQIFRKMNISYPLTSIRYQGVFWKIWHALFSWNTRFAIRPFALLQTISKLYCNHYYSSFFSIFSFQHKKIKKFWASIYSIDCPNFTASLTLLPEMLVSMCITTVC